MNPYAAPFTILNGLTSAPTPPVRNSGNGWGVVPPEWKSGGVEEAEIKLTAAGSNAVTVSKLIAGSLEPQVLADDDVNTVTNATDKLTVTSHAYLTGDGPVQLTTSGGLPAGLALATDYWIIVIDANDIQLADSFDRAMNSVPVLFTTDGTGTQTIVDTAATKRVKMLSVGFLGEAADGAVTLTISMGWRGRFKHSPETVVYSIVGTFGSAVATTARLSPLPIVR